MNMAAIVPSLNPDAAFVDVVSGLVGAGFKRVYVVNDGSDDKYAPLFAQAAAMPGVTLLQHAVNRGKGCALKTAFRHFLSDAPSFTGVVTVDGDGQHTIPDVVKVAKALEENPNTLVLGSRDFSAAHVPVRSAMGNKLTRGIFRLICGIPVTDTQTGLRGVPSAFARALLNMEGERYEYETNMLLESKRANVQVMEIPISTVYIKNNEASHFRPLADGLRIYFLILKYTLSSIAGFLVDFALFNLFTWILREMQPEVRFLIATTGARVFSALCNFVLNKVLVFSSRANTGGALLRYALLCIAMMLCSYGGVYLLCGLGTVPDWIGKILVDTSLFFVSFFVQRKWVFRNAHGRAAERLEETACMRK